MTRKTAAKRKTTAAQLDREIAAALAQPREVSKQQGRRVADIKARSPDAEFILEGEEFDLPWTEEEKPLRWFNVAGGQSLEYYAQSLDQQDLDRMRSIERWAKSRGSLFRALGESPVLAWDDGTVLDGTHRLLVAQKHGLRTVPVLVAPRPSWA